MQFFCFLLLFSSTVLSTVLARPHSLGQDPESRGITGTEVRSLDVSDTLFKRADVDAQVEPSYVILANSSAVNFYRGQNVKPEQSTSPRIKCEGSPSPPPPPPPFAMKICQCYPVSHRGMVVRGGKDVPTMSREEPIHIFCPAHETCLECCTGPEVGGTRVPGSPK
jgi:hypothetical protein